MSRPTSAPVLLDCLFCKTPFAALWSQERRKGKLVWVLPAVCEDCRQKPPSVELITNWEREEEA